MSETKRTAGPWVALRSIPEEGCDGWWIKAQPHAALRGFTHDLAWVNGGQENEANAHLIAAAPDMLEALALLIEEFDDPSRVIDEGRKGDFGIVEVIKGAGIALSTPAIRKARAALAKAEGRS